MSLLAGIIFSCFPALINTSIMMGQDNVPLPKDLFFRIINYVVPNIISPTHSEEIEYQEKKLFSYSRVAKSWKENLDKRFDFKSMESLFVGTYHYPYNELLSCYKERMALLKRSDSDPVWLSDQKNQINFFKIVISINNQQGHHVNPEKIDRLKEAINQDFFAPLALLLPFRNYHVWCELFDYALKVADQSNKKLTITIFTNQYMSYAKQYGRFNIIEEFINDYCFQQGIENYCFEIDFYKSSLFDFSFQKKMQKALTSYKRKGVQYLLSYIDAKGFLFQRLFDCIFNYIYLLVNDKISTNLLLDYNNDCRTIFFALTNRCNLNVFLQKKLSYMLKNNRYINDAKDCKIMFSINDLDYKLFLLSFSDAHAKMVKNDKNENIERLLNSKIIMSFFVEYKALFNVMDKKGKSFLYYLLLFVSNKDEGVSVSSLFEIFITKILQCDQVSFITYIDSESHRGECLDLFKENFKTRLLKNYLFDSSIEILKKFLGLSKA